MIQQIRESPLPRYVQVPRGDIGKRHQHEGALVNLGMGDGEGRTCDGAVAIEQEVQIERARSPPLPFPHPPVASLDALQRRQQVPRSAARAQRDNGVHVIGLSLRPDGRGCVQPGTGEEPNLREIGKACDRDFDLAARIGEVTAQPDVADDHASLPVAAGGGGLAPPATRAPAFAGAVGQLGPLLAVRLLEARPPGRQLGIGLAGLGA